MQTSEIGFWLVLAPSIGALIFAMAGYVQARTARHIGEQNKETLIDVASKVDGQLTKSREDAAAAAAELNILQGQLDTGHVGELAISNARDVVASAEVRAARLLEVASFAAARLIRQAKDAAAQIAPADVKSAALDAVKTAVEAEIARGVDVHEPEP